MTKEMRTFALAAALLASASVPALAQDKTVHMGTMIWEDLKPISLITEKFLEQEGYQVELTEFSEWGIAFGALSGGDIDLLASQVNYVTSDYWEQSHNDLEKVSVVSHGLYQGLVVPSSMPIDSIDQLNTVADQVGGKIIGIEPGSGLMRDVASAIDAYGLDYELVEGSTAAMTAELQSALERNEPVVTMLWEPSWMAQKFDVKFLKDPQGIFPPPQTYYWVAPKGFSAEDPHLRELIASVYVPIDDITAMNADVNNGMSMEDAVDKWWTDHADLIERWSVVSDE